MEPPFSVSNIMRNAPIGVFDSGIGGLTVLDALQKALPHENFIYIADSAHSPYGTKGEKLVHSFAARIAHFLEQQPVKAIVVACNTASAVLQQMPLNIKTPVFEVITPTAGCVSGQNIAAIATATTIRSGAYAKALAAQGKTLAWSKATPMLVPLVEEGLTHDPIAKVLLKHYFTDLPQNTDTLILGCTHYPVLKSQIQTLLPNVELVDAAAATTSTVKGFLEVKELGVIEGSGQATVYTTGDVMVFDQLATLAGFSLEGAKKLDFPQEAEPLGLYTTATPA